VTVRAFLVRGLLSGLVAGMVAFCVAYAIGEPQVSAAISIEESSSEVAHDHDSDASASGGAAEHDHDDGEAASGSHTHSEGDAVVSRHNQRTWGLLTGTLSVAIALGGLVALAAAAAVGRMGRLLPAQSTAIAAAIGYVSVALVPFLKYPPNPPAIGEAETIGRRTAYFFIYMAVSLAGAYVATVLAVRLLEAAGAYRAILAGAGAYLLCMVVAGLVMPTVNEVGDFPGDTLWYFRLASIATLTALWVTLAGALTGMVGRPFKEDRAREVRREFAASL
jgi:predicted cobalt transporter CbtA